MNNEAIKTIQNYELEIERLNRRIRELEGELARERSQMVIAHSQHRSPYDWSRR